jgi:hypothetical protein
MMNSRNRIELLCMDFFALFAPSCLNEFGFKREGAKCANKNRINREQMPLIGRSAKTIRAG